MKCFAVSLMVSNGRFGSAKRLNDAMDCNQYFESVGVTMSHKKRVTRSHLQVADFFSSLKMTLSFGTGKTSEGMVFGFIKNGGVF